MSASRASSCRAHRPACPASSGLSWQTALLLSIFFGWLAERIGRDGIITPNEQALLNYLREESPEIHPLLNELIDRFATAA